MSWYKDRDFPEVKASNSDIVAVIENPDQLRRVIDEYNRMERDYLQACQTIALMHEAAMGKKGFGPKRGVVEDVEDLRKERDFYREWCSTIANKERFEKARKERGYGPPS